MLYLSAGSIRLVLGALGIVGTVFAPPWVPFCIMIFLAVCFPAWEVLVIGLIVDLLWIPESLLHTIPLFTVAGLVMMWGFEPLRREFLVHETGLL